MPFPMPHWKGIVSMSPAFCRLARFAPLPVPPGEAVKIMTGAPVPPGCDTVVPIEDVEDDGDWIRLTASVKAGTHIRRRGEDIRQNDVVIPSGSLLRPQEIGMLSAMGASAVTVYRRAKVAILSTGDELLEPGSAPQPGKIINSNSYSLAAQVLDAGGSRCCSALLRIRWRIAATKSGTAWLQTCW